jgi:hypothetical protein
LLDALRVPTYTKYVRDILKNKRPLPTTEVIKLTEECSAAILNTTIKKKDPGCPTIDYSIGDQHFDNALCDLGASVSVMPKAIFDKLPHANLNVPAASGPVTPLPCGNHREYSSQDQRILHTSRLCGFGHAT